VNTAADLRGGKAGIHQDLFAGNRRLRIQGNFTFRAAVLECLRRSAKDSPYDVVFLVIKNVRVVSANGSSLKLTLMLKC